jgi:signal peptidase I
MPDNQPENQASNRNFFGGFASSAMLVWDFLKIVLIALVIIIPIRYFVFQPFIVSGSSMEPNYRNGQYLIIDELSYHFQQPNRGEVVVMRNLRDLKQYFIKRIIGLPGEKIQIDNGKITIFNQQHPSGEILNESYLPNQGLTYPHDTVLVGGSKILTLGPNEYFLMGDNRLVSFDSRDWGPLPRKDLVGRVLVRVLPLTKFDFAHAPAYGF